MLVDHSATVTITDSKNQKASVLIQSTNESLRYISGYGLSFDEGKTSTMDIEFGAGAPYTIEKTRGNASVAFIENDKVKVTSLGLGDTYYKLRDKRGSVAKLKTQTTLSFEMDITKNYLEFDGVNNLSVTVEMLWGTEWEIVGSTDNILESVSISPVRWPQGVGNDNYFLFIHTVNEGKGTDTITLKNSDGDLAAVKIYVK